MDGLASRLEVAIGYVDGTRMSDEIHRTAEKFLTNVRNLDNGVALGDCTNGATQILGTALAVVVGLTRSSSHGCG